MKCCIVQPHYSFNCEDTQTGFDAIIKLMDRIDNSADVIVLPEYCDIPAAQKSKTDFHNCIEKYNQAVLDKAKQTAKRCSALLFINCGYYTENGWRNTTYAIDKNGDIKDKYFKAHPAPSETKTEKEGGNELDVSYSYFANTPHIFEYENVRYGFMTCYDFYFYEAFSALARENVDVIIGCSHQRTDTHEALSIINRFLCYNTNAYLLRSSVSLEEDSELCGCSSIIAPDGRVIVDMKNNVGIAYADIDVNQKYYKPAGFMGKLKSHYEYIEEGRRPWLYRNCGSAIVPFDKNMPYPRICAHRGFNTVAAENSMPAFGAAVASGAEEIELDLWPTKDGEIVSCHDDTLDRVSTGTGKIYEHTYEELTKLDFGIKYGEKFAGLKILRFEDILKKFAGQCIMNIHIKVHDENAYKQNDIVKIVELIRKYDCQKHAYFMISEDSVAKRFKEYAPEISLCMGHDDKRPYSIVDRAIKLGAQKVQLYKPYFNQEMIDKAHAHGIICNVFFADDAQEAKRYIDMGIDVILTNDYLNIKNALMG